MLKRQELVIGLHVEVGHNGAKYFSCSKYSSGDFHGHVEAFGADWVVIRDSGGAPRVATAGDFKYLEIKPYTDYEDD